MRKRTGVLIPALLALAALALGFWGYRHYAARQNLQVALGNYYQRAFYNTSDHVQNLTVLLSKVLVSMDPVQEEMLFMEIWRQSEAALDNLTQLPVNDVLLERTAKFLTQVGDFSKALAKQVREGVPVSQEQWNMLTGLCRQAGDLNTELGRIHDRANDLSFDFYEMAAEVSRNLPRQGRQLSGVNFQTIDREMQNYPTLIYDGPFSDHLVRREALDVKGEEKITEGEAKRRALEFIDKKPGYEYLAQVTGTVEDNILAYRVEVQKRRGGRPVGSSTVVDVSRRGGKIIWYITPREIGRANWSVERAQERAKEFLEKHGYRSMTAEYYLRQDNVVTYNFAGRENGVVMYPDLVKVTVALDDGEVVAVDARNYLMSHHRRRLPEPELSEEQARALVSPRLKVQKGRLALIPLEAGREVLTWEFKGKLGEETFLVYINASSGREEKVLRLIESEDGALTV